MRTTQLTRRRVLLAAGTAALAGMSGCATVADKPTDASDWDGIEEFYLEGRVEAWTGIEPAIIAGDENPELVLFEGESYDFRWVNKDGAIHTLEIWDANGELVDEYTTESIDQEGKEGVLEHVVATPEMATYVCRFHRTTQVGGIDVRRA